MAILLGVNEEEQERCVAEAFELGEGFGVDVDVVAETVTDDVVEQLGRNG